MSRSTASPPLERGVLSKRHSRATEATKASDTRSARGACWPVLLGARTAPESVSRTYALDGRQETNLHSNPFGGALRC